MKEAPGGDLPGRLAHGAAFLTEAALLEIDGFLGCA